MLLSKFRGKIISDSTLKKQCNTIYMAFGAKNLDDLRQFLNPSEFLFLYLLKWWWAEWRGAEVWARAPHLLSGYFLPGIVLSTLHIYNHNICPNCLQDMNFITITMYNIRECLAYRTLNKCQLSSFSHLQENDKNFSFQNRPLFNILPSILGVLNLQYEKALKQSFLLF